MLCEFNTTSINDIIISVLILVVMEDALRDLFLGDFFNESLGVLILVVMEDALRECANLKKED